MMEKMLGVMIDCSRNAVMNVNSVKKYASIIRKMGYNTLMLYTEDTYEVNNQPYFGYLRGRYTKREIKELDAYCNEIGIELIPCIQTLAHLNAIFRWQEYMEIRDCDDILLCGNDDTYKLIEDMFETISECFSTKKIHIGMDEAYKVGLGQYRNLYGENNRFDIINTHLHKVCDIAKKYDFEAMIWSDMFCKLALNVESQYESGDLSLIKEKANLPDNVSLVYWDYYSTDYERYASNIKTNKAFGKKVYFAGGAWTWKGFAPDNEFSLKSTNPAVRACNDHGVDGMFFTLWGDDGNECSKFSVLPSLMYAAEISKGNYDTDSIKKKFFEIVGADFDTFMLLDKIDKIGGKHGDTFAACPNKHILYNDLFLGINDGVCSKEDEKYFENLACELKNVKGKGEYEYLFDTLQKLSEILALKVNLGNDTRKAYKENNLDLFKTLVEKYDTLLEKLKEFHEIYRYQWFVENKPHGFDVTDIRIGGLIQRILSSKKRICEYLSGEITQIPELDEVILGEMKINFWGRTVSVNTLSHNIIFL